MSKFKRYERYKDSGVEWIGEIPEHWGVIKLKYVTKLAYGDSLPTENREEEGEVDVFGSNGKVGTHNVANTLSPVIIVGRKGSYGKVTYSDKKCFAIDTTYYIDNRCTKSNIKWLYYSLMVLELDKNSQDTGVPGLSREYAYNKYVPVPTVNEQVAIANFLDQKTAEIDGLIADKEKLIELLQEKRQAIITEAVTKGLNPNVRLKDSGIEWIGEIPEHWEVCGFTKYISSIIDYRGKTPEKVDEGVFLVTAKNIKNGRIDYSLSQEYVKSEEYEQIMRRGLPEIGDVVFTTEAPLGEVANVDRTDVAFAQRVIKFRGKVEKLDNYYLKYWIMSHGFQHDLQSYATGSTATGIKASKLSKLIILLPRLEEQKAIVNFLDQKTAEIDDLIFDIYTQIQKLKEYRQSLISEAVTGKIDVRVFENKDEVIYSEQDSSPCRELTHVAE